MLRTNLQADSAEEAWSKYMQLTEAEASFSSVQERAFDLAFVPSEGATGQGPRPGGLFGLCPLGGAGTSVEASAGDRFPTLGQWSGQRSAFLADEGTGVTVHAAEC